MAEAAGVAALALTDHDCLDGLEEFRQAAAGFEPVMGVEISARREDRDVHLLGLFVDPGDPRLRSRLRELALHREERAEAMTRRLVAAGVPVSVDRVREIAEKGTVGRPHVARALVENGAAADVDEAFRRFLKPGRPGYVAKPGPDPDTAIAWIHESGGAAVLAHPGILRRDAWILEMARAGLDGIEVWHPKHHHRQRESFLSLAERLDLVPCGGSDYHGPAIGDAVIGQEPVPAATLHRLRQASRNARPRT
jgi:predicted metal-dependent phosphoesterase TrpH